MIEGVLNLTKVRKIIIHMLLGDKFCVLMNYNVNSHTMRKGNTGALLAFRKLYRQEFRKTTNNSQVQSQKYRLTR